MVNLGDHMTKVYCATKGLILKDGKFLVIRQVIEGKKFIDIPGGRMKFGASPKENLVREIKEELNLDVKIEKLVGVWYFFRAKDNDQVVCITYLCTPLKKEIDLGKNPDDEEYITEYLWVKPEEFSELEGDPFEGLETLKKLVKDYFNIN